MNSAEESEKKKFHIISGYMMIQLCVGEFLATVIGSNSLVSKLEMVKAFEKRNVNSKTNRIMDHIADDIRSFFKSIELEIEHFGRPIGQVT